MYIVINVSTYSTIFANIGVSSTGNPLIHEAYIERTVQWMGAVDLRERSLAFRKCLPHSLAWSSIISESWSSAKRFLHQSLHGPPPSAGVTGFYRLFFLKNIHVNFKGGKNDCQDIGSAPLQ